MTNYNLIVKQEADQEITEAYRWYENKSEGLGERFLSALEDCFYTIDINPTTYQKIYKDQRQAIVKTFPFVVMYEHNNNDIVVYAVFDTRQDPNKKLR
jgi:plasmid stabilization system protein ParE